MADCSHGSETESDDLRKVTDFMCKRGYTEEAIGKVRRDRIDVSAVQNMDDSELSRYIPAFGDRVNLRSLSKPETGRKAALFDKLRSKMKLQTKGNAQKLRRKIELGWMHNGKHVRSSNGGGSRKIELPREAKKADILKEAKEIFSLMVNQKKISGYPQSRVMS